MVSWQNAKSVAAPSKYNKGESIMSKKSLEGLSSRKYEVGIGEAISANRSDESGFHYFKRSKRVL